MDFKSLKAWKTVKNVKTPQLEMILLTIKNKVNRYPDKINKHIAK